MEVAQPLPIRFYSTQSAYAEFSNFHQAPILIEGIQYKTVEHYFQSRKFANTDPTWAQHVAAARNPTEAKRLGSSRTHSLDPKWESIKDQVMYRALHAKFTQHPSLLTLLLSTGNRPLIENAPRDNYWGCGNNGTGQNRLGQLLMQLRTDLLLNS
jgi:ribA/ribD-fused uncharacterized protein